MIAIYYYRPGETGSPDITLAELHTVADDPTALAWFDVTDPTPEDMDLLQRQFGFHDLALEDAVRPYQRPKIDVYDNYLFVIFYTLDYEPVAVLPEHVEIDPDAPPREIIPGIISMFVGHSYVVTIHNQPAPVLDSLQRKIASGASTKLTNGSAALLYLIFDAIVDDYFPVADAISDDIEIVESQVFMSNSKQSLAHLFFLKKQLLTMRRVVAPERDMMNVLLRRESPVVGNEIVFYMQDVYDHLIRVLDMIDSYREMLASAVDAYLMVASNRMNSIMKTLTASSIILMTATLVSGAFGMNFDRIPFASVKYGFEFTLLVIALTSLGIFLFLRRIRWF